VTKDSFISSLADIPRLQARLRPRQRAILCGDRGFDYETLDRRASQVANGLIAAGCALQERVAILTRNGDPFCEALLGCLKAGAVALPVNWRLAVGEAAFILRHAQVRTLLFAQEFDGLAREAALAAGLERTISIGEGEEGAYGAWRDAQSPDDPMTPIAPGDTAIQMYTSGTTGLPKGVQLTHRGYLRAMEQMERYAWGRVELGDVVMTPAPFFHLNGINPLLRTLAAGGTVVIPPQFDAAEIVDLIEARGVTRTTLAPAMIQACLEVPGVESRDFSRLKVIGYGGSPIAETTLRQAQKVFGCEFGQMYGLTETNGPVTFLHPEDHEPSRGKLLSCGRPPAGVDLKVVDADGASLPAGGVGEVLVRSETLMKGYWNDPAATAGAIVDGWFHTGDAGYLDEEGYLYIHDRVKDMIVSGGENIYPAEVENALFSHPAVADVAVIGTPDPKWGEAVKAMVVLHAGAEATDAELIAHARGQIAGYKLPKSIDRIAAIPRNAAGKILRRELRKPFWADAARNVA